MKLVSTCFLAALFGVVIVPSAVSGESPEGYWLMRAPVRDADVDEGVSYPKRFGTTGSPMFPFGNGQDVGVMWRSDTVSEEGRLLGTEERHCGAWFNVYFDEPGYDSGTIENIYCHVWVLRGETVGMSTQYNGHSFDAAESRRVSDVTVATVNNYDLAIYHVPDWNWSYDSAEAFHAMSLKANGRPDGGGVQLLSYPNQRSFCVVNLPDEQALRQRDTDNDGLDDYRELFETHTDPYDQDTDDDGFDDRHEFDNGKSGVDPYDWHRVHYYDRTQPGVAAFVDSGSRLEFEPTVEPWTSELSRQLDDGEFDQSADYDAQVNTFSYDTVDPGYWGFLQLNYRYTVNHAIDDILDLSVFWGGKNGPWKPEAWNDRIERMLRVTSATDPEGIILPGRKGYSPAMFMRSFRGSELSSVIDEAQQFHYGYFSKQRRLAVAWDVPWRVTVDYSGLRVVTRGDFLRVDEPTTEEPAVVVSGDLIKLAFSFNLVGRPVETDVAVDSVLVNGSVCRVVDGPFYYDGLWHVSCVAPSVDGDVDLQLTASAGDVTLTVNQSRVVVSAMDMVAPIVPDSVRKNRYISFMPGDVVRPCAYRVTVSRSELFPETEGAEMWVGLPDADGTSRFQCTPQFFVSAAMIDVGDTAIVPQTSYVVEATYNGQLFSRGVEVSSTPVWGDVVGSQIGSLWTDPNGVANFVDVWACVQAFQAETEGVPLSWTDINANRTTDFGDIAYVIEGVRGWAYDHGAQNRCE